MIMGWCSCIAPLLSKMQDQKVLMFHLCLFFEGGSNILTSNLPIKVDNAQIMAD